MTVTGPNGADILIMSCINGDGTNEANKAYGLWQWSNTEHAWRFATTTP